MRCEHCELDLPDEDFSYSDIMICKDCSAKKCEVCEKIVDRRQMINDKFACDICYGNISKSRNDQRITLLNSTPASQEIKSTKEIDEFDNFGREALSSALYLKNYDILGVSANATLGEIRDKCKELLKTWHPELHKDDAEKYSLAVKKVAEFKGAYESIVAEVEKPYMALELKYGASQKEVMQSYENLKSIYDPNNFDDNIQLKEKVSCKRNEITKAFEDLMMLFQVNPRTQNSAMRQQPIATPTQSNPLQPGSNSTSKNTTPLNIYPSQTPPIIPMKEPARSAKQYAKAWPRFFARTFDLWWESLLVGFATAVSLALINPNFADWINKPGSEALFGMLILPIVLFFDAVMYSLVGNTPGKMLLGLKVTSIGGIPLEFGEYFSRNMSVWFSGLALGFPLISLFTMANQHKRLGKGEPASYDYGPNYKVQAKPLGGFQITAFVILFIFLFFVMGILKSIGYS